MICVGCKVDKTATVGTTDGEQRCWRCHAEWTEAQTVGNIPAHVREEALADHVKKVASRKPAPRAREPERSAAKADVGSFDRAPGDPGGEAPRVGYFDGGIQYVPDDDGYW